MLYDRFRFLDGLHTPPAPASINIYQSRIMRTTTGAGLIFMAVAQLVIATTGAALEPAPIFIPAAQARPILNTSSDAPREMKGLSLKELEISWPEWVARQDAQVRGRVGQGETDTLANFLLLGTSFTREPQITDEYKESLVRRLGIFGDAVDRSIRATIMTRANDLANALAEPGNDERRLAMLEIVTRAGHGAGTFQDRNRLAQYLFENLVRYQNEVRGYIAEVERVKSMAPTRSLSGLENLMASLYQKRGLSTDTSLYVDYAIEQALKDLKEKDHIKPGSVIRVGIMGPGLDLIDKNGGLDLYPPQTAQPFVLMDTLLRLKLAGKNNLRVSAFDINPRVNRHIERAAKRARDGHAYTMHLVRRKNLNWPKDLVRFWEACGDTIGTPVKPAPTPDIDGLVVRAIRIRPEWVTRVHDTDLNIVYQQLPLVPAESFDLLIATNILFYYGPFEQGLALCNAARMLRPGGILLTNTALPEIDESNMRLIGSTLVSYSQTGADRMDWHRRDN